MDYIGKNKYYINKNVYSVRVVPPSVSVLLNNVPQYAVEKYLLLSLCFNVSFIDFIEHLIYKIKVKLSNTCKYSHNI